MKFSKKCKYHILCEDAQTRSFLYNVLKSQGINRHKIYIDMAPAGDICGSKYVAQKYPDKVKEYCSHNYQKYVLIVCSDADNLSIDDRLHFIERTADDIDYDRQKELITIWIPRKQIENWIQFWRNGSGEEEDFRYTGKPERCSEEAEMMSDYLSGQRIKEVVLSSIEFAKTEFERICRIQDEI